MELQPEIVVPFVNSMLTEARLDVIIDQLDDVERIILFLRCVQGSTWNEVAATLNISVRQARRRWTTMQMNQSLTDLRSPRESSPGDEAT